MHIRNLSTILLLLMISSMALSLGPTPTRKHPSTIEPHLALAPTTSQIQIIVTVDLAPQYSLFKYLNTNLVNVTIIPEIANPSSSFNVTVDVPMNAPQLINASQNVTYSLGLPGTPLSNVFTISFPPISTSRVVIVGYATGTSVLWRNSFDLPPIIVTSNYISTDSVVLILPSGSTLLKIFSSPGPSPSYSTGTIQTLQTAILTTPAPNSQIIVLYQPQAWDISSIGILAIIIAIFVGEPWLIRRTPVGSFAALFLSRLRVFFKWFDSRKLLAVFVLIGILMISLSFSAGPSPQLRIYSLASSSTSKLIATQVASLGGITLTPQDEISQLDTLGNVGAYTALVVADFSPPDQQFIVNHLNAAFSSAPEIILVDNISNPALRQAVQQDSRGLLLHVPDLNGLYSTLTQLHPRPNPIGLTVPISAFNDIMKSVGVLSLILVFFALSYLGFRLTQVGTSGSLGLGEALADILMVFVLAEGFYLVSSVLLGIPVGLHATLTNKVTAIGFLGFGGGSRPRFAIGILGFLFGGLVGMTSTKRLDRAGIFAFLVLSFFVLADPLTGGIIFYQVVNSFTIGPASEVSGQVGGAVRDVIGWALSAFSPSSPTYDTSHGVALYFALSTPLFVLRKLKPATGTALFFVSVFAAADGFIRIAEMRPIKILSDLFPGLAIALGIALVALAVSLAEGLVRQRL